MHLPKLSKWFSSHKVQIISAIEDNLPLISQHPSLQKVRGLQTNYKAREAAMSKKEKRWILKFNCIEAAIAGHAERLKLPCARIVSFGDGWFEKEALKRYSDTHRE